jgi:hypothetical protein
MHIQPRDMVTRDMDDSVAICAQSIWQRITSNGVLQVTVKESYSRRCDSCYPDHAPNNKVRHYVTQLNNDSYLIVSSGVRT